MFRTLAGGHRGEEPVEMNANLFEPTPTERSRGIGDHALLSDCHSTALVSCEESIDWACLRRMDQESTVARILYHDLGGYFSTPQVANRHAALGAVITGCAAWAVMQRRCGAGLRDSARCEVWRTEWGEVPLTRGPTLMLRIH